ncbi:hypothetical protein CDD82_68 [Ophiocordyceps australis]|uniref:Elongation factor 2 n=1 Tax=Ophiocordyceps australis TaxID=1399860 RepID=A0A2C5ZQZ5_9HYPO|nr:hypothetical protein CDD82_68 [Ophiocordyceps australis]
MSADVMLLHARSRPHPGFNYEFLIYLIVCGLVAIFFLLYFNRLFASIVSYAIRTYTWRRHQVWIDVKALQISLLGGRIFFTGLRYHGPNQTFLVQHGDITWRYWLRRVRKTDLQASSDAIHHLPQRNSSLPCRIKVSLVGLECFFYNRSPAYDAVLAGLRDDGSSASTAHDALGRDGPEHVQATMTQRDPAPLPARNSSRLASTKSEKPAHNQRQSVSSTSSSDTDKADGAPVSLLLQLFPIHVTCHKVAWVAGNKNVRAVLVAKADSASAHIDASDTKTCDPYRQIYRLLLRHPTIDLKVNDHFKEYQVARVSKGHDSDVKPPPQKHSLRLRRQRVVSSLRNLVPSWQRSVQSLRIGSRGMGFDTADSQIPASNQWEGLSRYLQEPQQGNKSPWSEIEYAATSTIIDSPEATLTVYWDVAGRVENQTRLVANINGCEPPAWGMSLSVNGGTINYGPWADRQRDHLQRFFFPSLSKDACPAQPLPAGATRVATQFTFLLEMDDTLTLRIPIREQSKDWRWQGMEPLCRNDDGIKAHTSKLQSQKASKGEAGQSRQPGWLEFKVPANSSVSYRMDMVASASGYHGGVDVDVPNLELWSSVNHDLLCRSGAQRISCNLASPLSWNSLRNWHFTVNSDALELFLIRDHILLLIDLVDDWASGPPSEYLVFTPFKYHVHLQLSNVRLYINVNDENIIDQATSLEDNHYLILSSPLLRAELVIPLDRYRPSTNAVPFDLKADTLDLSVNAPQSSPWATFLSSSAIGHAEGLTVTGSYQYNATTALGNTDTLILNVHGQSPQIYLYGIIIRYVLMLKDNYLGDYVHFKTINEYQEQIQAQGLGLEPPVTPPRKMTNGLDVILAVKVDDPRVMLPTNLYSAGRYVQCELADLSLDLRFTNYYMDMELDLSPLSLSLGNSDSCLESPGVSYSDTQLFLDGFRLYGHRAFGFPPSEPTYLCNWDVSLGAIGGECTKEFLSCLIRSATAFAFTFDDVENALVPYSSLIFHDITFAQVSVQSVHLWFHVDEAALLLSTDNIEINSNDWARSHYSRRADITIPNVQLSCVNVETATTHGSGRPQPAETEAYLRTDIRLSVVGRKHRFSEERKIQQDLVRRDDQGTGRTPFLLLDSVRSDIVPEQVAPPTQPLPFPPPPIVEVKHADETQDVLQQHSTRRLKHQSSFLSFDTSSSASVRRRPSQRDKRHGKATKRFSETSDCSGQAEPRLDHEQATQFSDSPPSSQPKKEAVSHCSVAFSSQYFAPSFPLNKIQPEIGRDFAQEPDRLGDAFGPVRSHLSNIDPETLSDEHAYASTLVEFPSGVTAFIKPDSVRHVTSLIVALQPTDPEDILDSLQVNAINGVYATKKPDHVYGNIQDLLVRLPQAKVQVINSSVSSSSSSSQEQDQYDLELSSVFLTTRTTTEDANSQASRTSFHLRLKSAEISASERLSAQDDPQAAFLMQIDNVVASLGAKDVNYFDVDVGSVVGSTASGKVEYLASLIHRTASLATDLETLFSETMSRQRDRVRLLVYRLVKEGQSTPDASFLIRPSAILRSSLGHVRSSDSWKLMMRLRQLWATTTEKQNQQLLGACKESTPATIPDAAAQVLSDFQKWRGWDLSNVSDSILYRLIFGHDGKAQTQATDGHCLLGVCHMAELQLVLDPGPKQNTIGGINVSMRTQEQPDEASMHLTDTSVKCPLTVVSLLCGEAVVNLNWTLCELADDVLRLYNRGKTSVHENRVIERHSEAENWSPSMFHFVLELSRGSVNLETMNLVSNSLSDEIRASIIMYKTETEWSCENMALSCDAVTSRLHSHSQLLGMFQLRQPSIFFAHETNKAADISYHNMNVVIRSQELQIVIKEAPTSLLETLDFVIKDEATQLYRLRSHFPTSPQTQELVKTDEGMASGRIHVFLFLEKYKTSIPLLQSLTYTISGHMAQAVCIAESDNQAVLNVDFDKNSHDFQINVRDNPQSISLVQMPPLHGRIERSKSGTGHVLDVVFSMDLVELDASAIYSLLAALNRPQISSAIKEIEQQTAIIRGHVAEVLGPAKPVAPVETQTSSSRLAYKAHLTFAGLRISAKTVLSSQGEPWAQILFSLEQVSLRARNQDNPGDLALKYPDLHVDLRQIGLDIGRGKKEEMVSCGSFGASVTVTASSRRGKDGKEDWNFTFCSDGSEVKLSPETVSTVIDVVGYLGSKIKNLDSSRELEYLRKLRQSKPRITINDKEEEEAEEADIIDSVLASVVYRFELRNIGLSWDVAREHYDRDCSKEDLMLSIRLIEFGTKTRKSARLTIEDLQLQTVPCGQDKNVRSPHSAVLPHVMFNFAYVTTAEGRRMAFQATGESLDLRLTSGFIIPAANLAESISLSINNIQQASAQWSAELPGRDDKAEVGLSAEPSRSMFGNKRLESLLIDADFAGAVVYMSSLRSDQQDTGLLKMGKYGQFSADDSGSGAIFRTPGLAWKAEYRDSGGDDATLYIEIKIDASSNVLYPSVMPLILDIMSSVKEVVRDDSEGHQSETEETVADRQEKAEKAGEDERLITADPSAVLGRLKLNMGLRIYRQEFCLNCQPIGRVTASASFESIYLTVNTVTSQEPGNLFAISGILDKPQASVQHVYSRESTASFDVDSVTLSFMNSKHVSGSSGVSAILKVSPMKMAFNARQAQDFLLFREIWYPDDLRRAQTAPVAKAQAEMSQGHLVQRYQQVAATAAFPWTATISIASLQVGVDLGQTIGKSVFKINDFWVSSKKTSDWEQNLCLGCDKIGIDCSGRLSGFVALQNFKLRTSIQWPRREEALNETPLIQASLTFHALRVKAAFDYQAFLVADITWLEFLMYNVRESHGDRLAAMLDGESVQVFGTTTSAAQAMALYQAVQKLIQERRENFDSSLQEMESLTKGTSVPGSATRTSPEWPEAAAAKLPVDDSIAKSPISLDTDVVVTLKTLNLGVFPSTFLDRQVLKMEALNAYARFAASMQQRRIHSILRMTLGQLRIGLAAVREADAPKTLSEMGIQDVVQRATGSRGGTILKVPRVEAAMETWQRANSNHIDYIFRSSFEGKVEVGWNYSRISYIRGMWANHSKSLEQTWGRQLAMTAVKIRGVPKAEGEQKQKITAEVKVPLSRYQYQALQPPVIETPQLRDMGEATPPLEWIGLQRERLPNLTHQIVIVSLLELAGEVEDAYSRILGSS